MGPGNHSSGPGQLVKLSQQVFEYVARSVSTSGQVGLPGFGFQVGHGSQIGQQSLFSYVNNRSVRAQYR